MWLKWCIINILLSNCEKQAISQSCFYFSCRATGNIGETLKQDSDIAFEVKCKLKYDKTNEY